MKSQGRLVLSNFQDSIYKRIRPFITRGSGYAYHPETVSEDFFEKEIQFELDKHSHGLIQSFFENKIAELVGKALQISKNPALNQRSLDIGCGVGELAHKVAIRYPNVDFLAMDLNFRAIEFAKKQYTNTNNLKFDCCDFMKIESRERYPLVTCLQTLEHIPDDLLKPFLEKLFALSESDLIVSTPREPNWCLANLARFKYSSRLGNTPEHIQHWTRSSFLELLEEHAKNQWGRYSMTYSSPLGLWNIVHVSKRVS